MQSQLPSVLKERFPFRDKLTGSCSGPVSAGMERGMRPGASGGQLWRPVSNNRSKDTSDSHMRWPAIKGAPVIAMGPGGLNRAMTVEGYKCQIFFQVRGLEQQWLTELTYIVAQSVRCKVTQLSGDSELTFGICRTSSQAPWQESTLDLEEEAPLFNSSDQRVIKICTKKDKCYESPWRPNRLGFSQTVSHSVGPGC